MADISVIIPTWNRAATIELAVRSALEQTTSPLEVLVCDDGSTDESRQKILSIGDERVRWIGGPRAGRPAVPRNRGIQESRGEWLAFLDSDDEWKPEKLERQLSLAAASGCSAVCSNGLRLLPGIGIEGSLLKWDRARISFADLLQDNRVICSSAFLHRSLFAVASGFPEDEHLRAWEDYALWLRIATQTDFAFVNEPLLLYRDDAANSARSTVVDFWGQRRAVFSDFEGWSNTQGISSSFMQQVRKRRWRDLALSKVQYLVQLAARVKKAL